MNMINLFNVLVIGGAALTANATSAAEKPNEPVEKKPAFCGSNYPGSCVAIITDKNQCAITAAPGLECCWGTSCNE